MPSVADWTMSIFKTPTPGRLSSLKKQGRGWWVVVECREGHTSSERASVYTHVPEQALAWFQLTRLADSLHCPLARSPAWLGRIVSWISNSRNLSFEFGARFLRSTATTAYISCIYLFHSVIYLCLSEPARLPARLRSHPGALHSKAPTHLAISNRLPRPRLPPPDRCTARTRPSSSIRPWQGPSIDTTGPRPPGRRS